MPVRVVIARATATAILVRCCMNSPSGGMMPAGGSRQFSGRDRRVSPAHFVSVLWTVD
jgi:hypothetical protein